MFDVPAYAQQPGWYAGVNGGQSEATIDNQRISSGLLGDGLTTASINDNDRDAGYKLYGGYQFNNYFAIEGGYFDLGKFGFTADTRPLGTLNGTTRLRGLNVDAVGTLPLIYQLSAFGRVGANVSQASDSFNGSGAVYVTNPHPSQHSTNLKVGAGLEYAFTRALGLRLEVERYRIEDGVGNKGDIDLVSVGLVYRFGADARVPDAVVVADVPPPPPPYVPPPPPPPAAPPPVRMKSVLSADSLFDFGAATVKPAGQQALNQFLGGLKGANYDVITVSGYTDRLGPKGYNQGLSERRANAVKNYLVTTGGIPAERIVARGMDGSNPVTRPDQCEGSRATQQLIACLQPDRRVELEVSVSK